MRLVGYEIPESAETADSVRKVLADQGASVRLLADGVLELDVRLRVPGSPYWRLKHFAKELNDLQERSSHLDWGSTSVFDFGGNGHLGGAVEIPYAELEPDTLRAVIEEFVSREGTDYGERIFTLDEKVAHVMAQLNRREAVLVFDEESETCHIIVKS